jgi:hypothetical protein
MKIALCFIINYEHILNKEEIWREWIEPNKDIINVYFYYKDLRKIKSKWIYEHTIPPKYIVETSYYHVIPAYLSIMSFAYQHDTDNKWFSLLTESCCPIISPKKFRYLFYENYNKSIFNWKKPWWNIHLHKRANLYKLPEDLRLANDPWFVLKREHVNMFIDYVNKKKNTVKTICNGGLANESLFAIILATYKQLDNNSLISESSHTTDWVRMDNTTSPHTFKEANDADICFIEKSLKGNKYLMFIRKISRDFPNDILKKYIYEYSKDEDDKLVIKQPLNIERFFSEIAEVIIIIFSIFSIYYFWQLLDNYIIYKIKN